MKSFLQKFLKTFVWQKREKRKKNLFKKKTIKNNSLKTFPVYKQKSEKFT